METGDLQHPFQRQFSDERIGLRQKIILIGEIGQYKRVDQERCFHLFYGCCR